MGMTEHVVRMMIRIFTKASFCGHKSIICEVFWKFLSTTAVEWMIREHHIDIYIYMHRYIRIWLSANLECAWQLVLLAMAVAGVGPTSSLP